MRLYNIYFICKTSLRAIENIVMRKKEYGNTGECDYEIENWRELYKYYELIYQIDILKDDVDAIYQIVKKSSAELSGVITVTPMAFDKIEQARKNLILKMKLIVELCQSYEFQENREGVDIRIPKCHSFKEYVRYMKDIDFVFSQCPLINQADGKIEFNTVDIGSMWLSFLAVGTGAYSIIKTISIMVDIALKMKLQMVVIKQQEELLETMRQQNEIREEEVGALKKLIKIMLDEAVKELEHQCDAEISDPENRDRAARSLQTLSELLDKGIEICSAIGVSEEIKAMFPFKENSPKLPKEIQDLIVDNIKKQI